MDLAKIALESLKQFEEDMTDHFDLNEGTRIGIITNLEVPERKTQDGKTFYVVKLEVRFADGKRYFKQYSVDFFRDYENQLGIKADDIIGAAVVARPTTEFKRISYFAFIEQLIDEGLEGEEMVYIQRPYINKPADLSEIFKRLGI